MWVWGAWDAVRAAAMILLRRSPRLGTPVARVGAATSRTFVVFLHGLRPLTSATDYTIAQWDTGSATVIAPEIAYHMCGIDAAADAVVALIDKLTDGVERPRILVVGHSMGGRAALEVQRRMLDVERSARQPAELRVITLGSPLRGTWATCMPLAGWFLGATAPLTPMFAADPPRVACFHTRFDHMVRPSTAWVPGAAQVDASVTTHWTLPVCWLVRDYVYRFCHDMQ